MSKYFIELSDRAIIKISGNDARKFLQGLISNDIGKLDKQDSKNGFKSAIYTYFLTPQGKYLFDFFIIKIGDEYFIDCLKNQVENLIKKLKIYKLRSDVNISYADKLQVFLYSENPSLKNGIIFQDTRNSKLLYRVISDFNNLHPSDFLEKSFEEYAKLRVENLIPEGDYDHEQEKSFPLQYRMIENNAVDFLKGCYVGQEVTARTHHRGVVRKTLYKLELPSGFKGKKNDEIFSGDITCGQLLSFVENSALALIDKEIAVSKTELSCNNLAVKVF